MPVLLNSQLRNSGQCHKTEFPTTSEVERGKIMLRTILLHADSYDSFPLAKGQTEPCWLSQLSALVSKAIEKRNAIRGLTPTRPLTMPDKAFRLTPRDRAAAVTVKFNGSRHSCLSTSPGCGGLYIFIYLNGSPPMCLPLPTEFMELPIRNKKGATKCRTFLTLRLRLSP